MTSENGSADPYAVVLADLRAKRDQIDSAIAALERLRGGNVGSHAGDPAVSASGPVAPSGGVLDAGAFLGMTIPDAAVSALRSKRRTMGNAEMVKVLREGGLVMNSADPINTVGSVLTRRFDKVGDIVRVDRGVWGLKEWYPNRTFKTAKQATASAPDMYGSPIDLPTNEHELPSGQTGANFFE